MPSLKIHEEFSLEKYGRRFTELHKWMDEPVKTHGPSHRRFRHDVNKTPKNAEKLFGKDAELACIDHIILDRIEEKNVEELVVGIAVRITKTTNRYLLEYAAFMDKSKSEIIRTFVREGLIKHAHIGLLKQWNENREYTKEWLKNPNGRLCEKCDYNKDVVIYHIDGDIENFDSENIVFLCRPCLINLQRFLRRYDPKEKFASWFFLK